MGYELIICEKPSQANKVAGALGKGKAKKLSNNGVPTYELTYKGQKIYVVPSVGHLFTITQQEENNWSYPIFDIKWQASHIKKKTADYTKKYLDNIKKYAKNADDITVSTDNDIEGHVIGYTIVTLACKKNDANRMLFSSLAKKDLIKSYENKKQNMSWGNINAGITRHKLDWLYGINVSRALSKSYKSAGGSFKILSSGRVQGPALKLIVDKEKSINAFVSDPYWQLKINVKKNIILEAWHRKDKIPKDRFLIKEEAQAAYNDIKNEKEAKVIDLKKSTIKKLPPVPFDLTTLQTEASAQLRFPPKLTQSLAQNLYSNALISYPRTSSQKLPPSLDYKNILEGLANKNEYKEDCEYVMEKTDMIPMQGKKDDPAHPAIHPTGQTVMIISEPNEKKLYDLIVRRFLAVFGETALREKLTITLDVNKQKFITEGITTIKHGWLLLYGKYGKQKDEELPKMNVGDMLPITKKQMLDKKTLPPKRYTEVSIIKALEKENLGTKATRVAIVEKLKTCGYITGKSIEATELGIQTCDVLVKYVEKITNAKLTRRFEELMGNVEHDKKSIDEVLDEAKVILTDICKSVKSKEKDIGAELIKANNEKVKKENTVGKCPNCDDGELVIRKGKYGKFVGCNSHPDCKTIFSLPDKTKYTVTDKMCEHCKLPMLDVESTVKKGKKRGNQIVCFNKKCSSKDNGDMNSDEKRECNKCKKDMKIKSGLYGRFWACSGYPKCKNTIKVVDINETVKMIEDKLK